MSTGADSSSTAASTERPCVHCHTLLPVSARFCGKCGARVMRDFFISYNHADQGWAEWIAWHLEAAGYTTLIQAWDIRPGSNFIVEMDQAFKSTNRTIAVLSPDYLTSQYTTPEWADALLRDPTGAKRLLVPVRVRDCQAEGWLAAVVYIDLLGQSRKEARKRLLEGIQADGRSVLLPVLPMSDTPAYPAAAVALWNVPYRRNPYFSGRADLLEQVHATFFKDKERLVTQALTGLGGSGKTQTAVEYAYRYQEEYQAVFWAQAETREQLLGEVAQLATLLNLPEREAQDQALVIAAVRRWLEAHPGWLLVLDNVEELRQVQEVVPTKGRGHVLQTTRAQALGSIEGRARVESLPTEEAMHFLLRRAQLLAAEAPLVSVPPEQQRAARAIVEELGGLLLALDQAGAYIEETDCGLEGYLNLYRMQRKALLSHRGESASDHLAVDVTWATAFKQVEQRSVAGVEVLRLCAYLAPEGIPEALFKEGGDGLPPALKEAVEDALAWNAALAALRRFSLLDKQAETETLSLHRLVQVVVQEALPANERRAWAECAVRLVNRAFPNSEDFATWERCQQLLPHALLCAEQIEKQHLVFTEAASLLAKAGEYLYYRARYEEALPLYQRALAIREQVLGLDHPDVAESLNNLAVLYKSQGQYGQALPLYQRALKIDEQVFGPDHPEVATSLNNLGLLYETQGQYAEALALYQRALAIREQALGPNHPNVATSLNNLGLLYETQGQYAEALALYQRALAIWEQALGPNHPNVATSLNNLAELYETQGQYAEALPFTQRALAIKEQALGSAHPSVATSLSTLASLYQAQGEYAEALPLYQRALKIDEQALGPDHPDVATDLNNLAGLYQNQGQYAEALSLYQRALKIDEQALGPDHPDVAQSLNNLALLYYAQGQYAEALPLYQRALAIWEQALGPNHPNVVSCLENLAVLLRAIKQKKQARALEARAQAIRARRQAAGR